MPPFPSSRHTRQLLISQFTAKIFAFKMKAVLFLAMSLLLGAMAMVDLDLSNLDPKILQVVEGSTTELTRAIIERANRCMQDKSVDQCIEIIQIGLAEAQEFLNRRLGELMDSI